MTTTPPTEQQLDEIEAHAAAPGSWGVYEYGNDGSVTDITAEVRRLRTVLDAEKSAHLFTLRQRNNRSNRITHLRDLANAAATGSAADVKALIDAARDTLAASVDDHTACAVPAAAETGE